MRKKFLYQWHLSKKYSGKKYSPKSTAQKVQGKKYSEHKIKFAKKSTRKKCTGKNQGKAQVALAACGWLVKVEQGKCFLLHLLHRDD